MEEVQNVTVNNDTTKQTVYYKRVDVDGGVMTDIDDIENFKSVQRRDVINNYMLGDFNDIGDYVVAEKVLSGLVEIRKTVSNEYNNMIFLKSMSEFAEKNKLEFCIVIKELSDDRAGYATAIMKLLEPVNKINGYVTNTNSFIVASFTDKNDELFIGKVKKVFGVVESNDTNGKDDPKVIAEILNRIAFLRHCKDMSISVFASVESEYYHNRLEILKQKPEYEAILKKYRSLILKAGVFLDPNSPEYFAYMNELLDQAIDNAINEDPSLKDKLKNDLKEVDTKHNNDSKKYTKEIAEKANEIMNKPPVVAEVKKPEVKKTEEKKPVKKEEKKKIKPKVDDKAGPKKDKDNKKKPKKDNKQKVGGGKVKNNIEKVNSGAQTNNNKLGQTSRKEIFKQGWDDAYKRDKTFNNVTDADKNFTSFGKKYLEYMNENQNEYNKDNIKKEEENENNNINEIIEQDPVYINNKQPITQEKEEVTNNTIEEEFTENNTNKIIEEERQM